MIRPATVSDPTRESLTAVSNTKPLGRHSFPFSKVLPPWGWREGGVAGIYGCLQVPAPHRAEALVMQHLTLAFTLSLLFKHTSPGGRLGGSSCKRQTLDFSSGHDLVACGTDPHVRLCEAVWSLFGIFCLPLSLPLPHSHVCACVCVCVCSLFLAQNNK